LSNDDISTLPWIGLTSVASYSVRADGVTIVIYGTSIRSTTLSLVFILLLGQHVTAATLALIVIIYPHTTTEPTTQGMSDEEQEKKPAGLLHPSFYLSH